MQARGLTAAELSRARIEEFLADRRADEFRQAPCRRGLVLLFEHLVDEGNEPLLQRLDLTATVVTADALHTQHAPADWLVGVKQAEYVLIVKANQPSLHCQLSTPALARGPRRRHHTHDRGHNARDATRLLALLGITSS
jgi:hypothetical protein